MAKIIGSTTTTPVPRSDWNQTDEKKADFILNKPDLGNLSSKDVIEKTDLAEDVQASLDNAITQVYVDTQDESTLTNANAYTDEKIALLMNNSSTAVDSIMELAEAMKENEDVVSALNEAVGKKANVEHTHDDSYYTEAEIDAQINDLSANMVTMQSGATMSADEAFGAGPYVIEFTDDGADIDTYSAIHVPYDHEESGLNANNVQSAIDETIGLLDRKSDNGHTHNKSEINDFPTSMPASDVYDWAKAETKPSYTANEVGAAKAGFGYGEEMISLGAAADETHESFCAKLDEIIATMQNFTTKQIAVCPPNMIGAGRYFATIFRQYAEYCSVVGYSSNSAGKWSMGWRIVKDNNVWNPVEWDNPPMDLNIEYRTTERIAGKAVYKKNINGTIQYRLDGETEWKPYADVVGAVPTTRTVNGKALSSDITLTASDVGAAPSSHTSDTTSHITAAERTAWNGKAAGTHNHGASEITSGTLAAARGGTGSNYLASAQAYAIARRDSSANTLNFTSTANGAFYATSANGAPKFGTLPVAQGGTGATTAAAALTALGAAASSHNQAANTITAGTLGGQVVANATAIATLGTAQVRNIYAGTSDLTAGSSSLATGAIYFVYE